MKFKETKVLSGFKVVRVKDEYDNECSIQESSAIDDKALWLGINDAKPSIMVSDAQRLGIDTKGQKNGWVSYDVPEEVEFSTRMYLTKKQALLLAKKLKKFAKRLK